MTCGSLFGALLGDHVDRPAPSDPSLTAEQPLVVANHQILDALPREAALTGRLPTVLSLLSTPPVIHAACFATVALRGNDQPSTLPRPVAHIGASGRDTTLFAVRVLSSTYFVRS